MSYINPNPEVLATSLIDLVKASVNGHQLSITWTLATQAHLSYHPKPRTQKSTLSSFQAFCQTLGRHKRKAK